MIDDELWLLQLNPTQRARFFAELSHGMTVAMRVVCRDVGDALTERVNSLNEAHHIVSRYLLSMQMGHEDTRWIKPILSVVSSASDPLVAEQLDLAWQHAKRASGASD